MLRQLGQAMVEYTIVTAAFVVGLLVLNNGACPDEYEDCIEYLLTVMHDNADGYSNSISAVQDYGRSYRPAAPPPWPGGGVNPPDDDGASGDPGSLEGGDRIEQATQITDPSGNVYGVLDGSNVVDDQGNVVGTYNSETGVFVPANGGLAVIVMERRVVRDEEGKIMPLQAVVDCGSGQVLGFGYRSDVSGKFVNSLNLAEDNIAGYCLAPTFEVVTRDGRMDGGRIVNGHYYPVALTAVLMPTEPAGEVVFWPEFNDCAVMVTNWDAGLDPELDAEERYQAQVDLYADQDPATAPLIGRQMTGLCDSARTVTAP